MNRFVLNALGVLALALVHPATPSRADSGDAALGAIGGLVVGEMLHQGEERNRALDRQTRAIQGLGASGARPAAPPPAYAPPAVAPPPPTVEQRLGKLQRLRQQGLITDGEYAARRQAILDSL